MPSFFVILKSNKKDFRKKPLMHQCAQDTGKPVPVSSDNRYLNSQCKFVGVLQKNTCILI